MINMSQRHIRRFCLSAIPRKRPEGWKYIVTDAIVTDASELSLISIVNSLNLKELPVSSLQQLHCCYTANWLVARKQPFLKWQKLHFSALSNSLRNISYLFNSASKCWRTCREVRRCSSVRKSGVVAIFLWFKLVSRIRNCCGPISRSN